MSHWGPSRTLLVAFDTRVHTLVTPKSKIHDLIGCFPPLMKEMGADIIFLFSFCLRPF